MFRKLTALAAATTLCGVASADDLNTIQAELSYDIAKLETADGAGEVMSSLERQAREACEVAYLSGMARRTDFVCARDILFQAVESIDSAALSAEYAASDLAIEAPSQRVRLAQN